MSVPLFLLARGALDGAGAVADTTVSALHPGALELMQGSVVTEPAPAPRFALVQAPAKGERDLAAIAAATELGVDEIVPWAAQERWR